MLTSRVDTHRASAICAAVVVATALVVLVVGWGFDVSLVVRLYPNFPAMVPGTAIALLLLGVAHLLALRGDHDSVRAARVLYVGAFGFTLVKLALHFEEHARLPESADRMAFATLIGLLMVVASGLCTTARRSLPERYGAHIATTGLLLCTIALVGYLYDPASVASIAIFLGLAIPTAVSLLLLFVAILLSSPADNWLATLTARGPAAKSARSMLPLALSGPIFLCYLALLSTDVGLITPTLRLGTLAVLLSALAIAGVVRNARFYDEARRRGAAEQARLSRTFDGLSAAVFVVDSEDAVVMTNKAARQLVGNDTTPEDWLQSAAFHSLDDRSPMEGAFHPVRQILAARGGHDLYAGWFGPGGAERALRFSAMDLPEDRVTLIVVSDETQSWMLQETLNRTERLDAIGQLSGGISHELANILGVIRLTSDTAVLGNDMTAMRTQLEAIRKACDRGADLMDRLLHLSREPTYTDTLVDVTEITRSAVLLARGSMLELTDLVAKLDAIPELYVAVPGADLQSAVLNLLLNARNAVEASDRQGRVEVEMTADADEVTIRVSDTGIGMSDDVQRKAREPFFTTRRAYGGSGLGLSMVDSLARRTGGRLDIQSVPGKGTVIEMVLPRSTGPGPQADEDTMIDGLHGISVLLVEDDRSFADAVTNALELFGVVPLLAHDAAQAMQVMEDHGAPDILLTDIGLPGGVFGDVLAVEAVARYPGLRVIYMSGNPSLLHRSDRDVPGLRLKKPIHPTGLANAIRLTMSGSAGGH